VLTAFRAQLERGGPLTVTDPEATRFFMTVEEAVQLVVQAAAIGEGGTAMVLDMGEQVRIAEVAEQLAQTVKPPCLIEYVGLRPGEKLHEELFGDGEHDVPSVHPLIRSVQVPSIDGDAVRHLPTTIPDDVSARVMRQLVDEMALDLAPRSVDLTAFDDWQAVVGD
jgi:FlaA1/EpsC-like NDP-sugar epimerase